jgi:hypothetical protein
MADRYWVGASGTSWLFTSSWSATSGGTGGASVPTSTDNVIFDRATTYFVDASLGQTLTCANFTVSAGTVTFRLSSAALYIYGDYSVVAATTWSNQSGSIQFVGSGTQNITTNGTNTQQYVVFAGTGTYQLQDNFSANAASNSRNVTFLSGTLDLNNKQFTCQGFSASGTGVRSISFGTTGKFVLVGSRTTGSYIAWDATDATNFTTSGTAVVDFTNANNVASTYNFSFGVMSEADAISFNIKGGGTGTVGLFAGGLGNTCKNIDFTGFVGAMGNHIYAGSVVYGNWTFSTGMTIDNSTSSTAIKFAKSSGTQTITSNGKSFNCPLSFDSAGGTLFLADALSVSAFTTVRTLTLVNGTFDGNNKTITNASTGAFSSTDTVTVKNVSTALGFTMTSGTLTQGAANTFGSVTLNNGTFDGGGFTTTGAFTKVTGSVLLQNVITASTFTHTSGTLTLSTNNSVGAYSFANGTLDLNGYTLSAISFATAAGTKNLLFDGGTLSLSAATTTAFNNAVPTGFTTTRGTATGTIRMTAATAKTFVGGGSTYNCILSNDGAGALTISGSNTISALANGVQPTAFTFTSGTTQTISNWLVRGTFGSLVTLTSTTAGSAATLSKPFGAVVGDYLSIKDITVTGGATWYSGANSTNVSGNTGWTFSAAPADFLPSFAITEPQDVAAIGITAETSAALAATDPPDVASVVTLSERLGIASYPIAARGIAGGVGVYRVLIALEDTEEPDVASFTSEVLSPVSLNVTEPPDTAEVLSSVYTAASIGASEPADVLTSNVTAVTAVTFEVTEPSDVVTFDSHNYGDFAFDNNCFDQAGFFADLPGYRTVVIGATEQSDQAAAAINIASPVQLAGTEARDVALAYVDIASPVALAVTEGGDSAAGQGRVENLVALQPTEPKDQASIGLNIVWLISMSSSEAPDVVSANVSVFTPAQLSVVEPSDTASAELESFILTFEVEGSELIAAEEEMRVMAVQSPVYQTSTERQSIGVEQEDRIMYVPAKTTDSLTVHPSQRAVA